MQNKAIVWFRKDLRLLDNPAFYHACKENHFLIPLYIVEEIGSAQKWWLHHSLKELDASLKNNGLSLIIKTGDPKKIIKNIVSEHYIQNIYWNRRYDPESIKTDSSIKQELLKSNICVKSFNGSLLKEPWSIKTKSETPFKVFTSFSKALQKESIIPEFLETKSYPKPINISSENIDDLGFVKKWSYGFSKYWNPGEENAIKKLESFIENYLVSYKENRNIPSNHANSSLSPHIHFGEISIGRIYQSINNLIEQNISAESFLNQLFWREFAYHTLYHYKEIQNKNLKTEFDSFPYKKDEILINLWQKGLTGVPIVDAGMRELWKTGYMHNRVRMIVASFLTKNLLIDWRTGANWFLDTLLDADIAINSFSWQWVAGTGFDAAPYFRIFNPYLQSQKFDPNCSYIKQWVEELKLVDPPSIHNPNFIHKNYTKPIINYEESRKECLRIYNDTKTK